MIIRVLLAVIALVLAIQLGLTLYDRHHRESTVQKATEMKKQSEAPIPQQTDENSFHFLGPTR